MGTLNRREFLTALGAGAAALPVLGAAGQDAAAGTTATGAGGPQLWIDPKMAALPARPWRKIHEDFHNTEHIGKICEAFNADEWGDRLEAGNVNAIVVFAKDMHGYFYYPSKFGPVHPGLSIDLLGAQVAACRQRKIAVYAYYCTTWDHHLAGTHHEWLMLKRDGSNYLPKKGQTPGWTALCLGQQSFVDLMVEHTREFVSRYELDGAWYDMAEPIAPECHCAECVRALKAAGKDPKDAEAQRARQNQLFLDFHRTMRATVRAARPGCQVDFNDIGLSRLGDRAQLIDNNDIEALPTGSGWGYFYFPAQVRYARTHGVTCYGMTGRFKSAWADFGGLKQPAQLDVELASIVANAARCDIGDQLPPSGRLDPAVYHVIGKSYGRIKRLEPWLEGAVPVTEAALLVPGTALERMKQDYVYGMVKLLLESRVQFDVVEPDQPWERYGMVIVPDEMRVEPALEGRLHAFIKGGGAAIAIHQGGLLAGEERSWLERYGLRYAGASPFKPAYLVPEVNFTGDIPKYEYALYEGASQWRAEGAAKVLARLGEPKFQRSAEHYTSHAQTPFDHLTDYAAVARSGAVGLVGFPLGRSYFQQGYWVYRAAFQKLLEEVLPARLVESSAPLSTEITVTHQAAEKAGGRERYMVHIINFSALRATPQHPAFHEDPIPLTDVRVRLRLPVKVGQARAVDAGREIAVRPAEGGGVEFVVPRVPIHEIVCLEV